MSHPYYKNVTGMVPNVFIKHVEIESVNTFNFLYVTLDESITWIPYIFATVNIF